MNRFISERLKAVKPYVPGEQPKSTGYIKLNTNESPFPPSEKAVEAAKAELEKCRLYPDPEGTALRIAIAKDLGVNKEEIILANGSDEVLDYAFLAFCDQNRPAVFADITYGFYKVFAKKNGVPYVTVPLKDDFSLDVNAFSGGTLFIANPNAPTGLCVSTDVIESIIKNNPNNVVVIDEAYVDFGAESAVKLINKYDNLLVTRTFSKSRSMAGARLGFGVANRDLIVALNTVRYSSNPYNVNRVTLAMGVGSVEDDAYFKSNIKKITENREYAAKALEKLGFSVTDSKANFLFASSDKIDGKTLYLKLKQRKILVRHFDEERINQFIRITVGEFSDMEKLIFEIKNILEEL